MDRCALFVDAGYALADGAMAVHGTRRRDSVSWDHSGLLKLLAGLARDRTGLPVLRCYWYETADGGRTAEHDALAEMPGLKLRLVNTRPGRREGIESQLRRDIVTLAKSGAIADAFIASSDEHLAEIVAEVQDLGLRVVVLHIASDGGWTIPQPLRQECDDIVEISAVHLRPFVDLIRGAEPAAEEQYVAGYGSRSSADGGGSVAPQPAQSGVSAQAPPAQVGTYQASGGPDSGPAQPYVSSGRSSAPEQALMAVRGGEAGAGSDQFGTGGLSQGAGQPYDAYGAAAHQQAASGQHAAADRGMAEPAQAHHGGQHALPEQAQQPSRAPGQDMADGAVTHYGHHAGGQHASQNAAPQRAAQGRGAQHPAHAALEALEAGAYPGGDTGSVQPASHSQPGGGHLGSAQPGGPQAGVAQPGGAQPGGAQLGGAQPGSAQSQGAAQHIGPVGGVGPVGIGPGAEGPGGRDDAGRGTGYPDSAPNGTHAQGSGYQSGSYQSGSYQNGGYQNGGYHSGELLNGGFQGAGFPAARPGAGPGQSSPGPGAPGQGGPGQGGPGQGNSGQTSTVHHLSGLSFPAGTVGSSQNGVPTGPSSNGAAQPGGYPNGSGQNGTGLQATPGYQNGSAQNAPGQYGSFGGYQPGTPNNGSQVNPGLTGGGSRNTGGNGVPAGGSGAGQPSPYGASDPGYFPGPAVAGQQAPHPASQPGQGMNTRDAYGAARDAYGQARDAYGPAQAAEPSFQPHAAGQAPSYQAQPHLPPQSSQPVAPLPAVRAPQPVAISLPEAVKAAHSEGFTFGESVGRDAPGLWLEAVLARKPRMPSDLEARLLQGSVLPIDSLLHDEVRHSLRRGFWEALESARR